jgi:hypothetical protein
MKKVFGYLLMTAVASVMMGCGTAGYHKLDPFSGGYAEMKHDDGTWEVQCMGGQGDFSVVCGAYRCAEFTFENGCRYFVIVSGEDLSGIAKGGQTGYGGRASVYMGRARYMIKIYKTKPDSGDAHDAYEVLNNTVVPGTKEVFTVAQRLSAKQNAVNK